jgi:uncharacterized membrane protein
MLSGRPSFANGIWTESVVQRAAVEGWHRARLPRAAGRAARYRSRMGRGRLEAFSDGVIAILITIMVLELKLPQGHDWDALFEGKDVFLAYVLSFVYLGIYWNNHHHMLHATERVSGSVLWANLHLLFWLSLVPFATKWMGEYPVECAPVALYGIVLFAAAIAYTILQTRIVRAVGSDSTLAHAVGRDRKGKVSIALYCVGIASAFAWPLVAYGCYTFVALLWLVPDRRIERHLAA